MKHFLYRLLAALFSGGLLALCYAPFDQAWLVWVWLLPLLTALWKPGIGFWKGFLLGWLFGLIYLGSSHWWMSEVHPAAVPLVVSYMALYPAFWAGIAAGPLRVPWEKLTTENDWKQGDRKQDQPLQEGLLPELWEKLTKKNGRKRTACEAAFLRILLLAGLWAGLEWLRGYGWSGYGWNDIGVPLLAFPNLVQVAEVTGCNGLAFFIITIGGLLWMLMIRGYCAYRKKSGVPWTEISILIILCGFFWQWGTNLKPIPNKEGEGKRLRVALLQTNITLEDKRNSANFDRLIEQLQAMTMAAVKAGPVDLIVWPESSFPNFYSNPDDPGSINTVLRQVSSFNASLLNPLLQETTANLLIGADLVSRWTDPNKMPEEMYVGAVLLKGDTSSAKFYRKNHLVPFGEFLPWRKSLPFVESMVGHLVQGDFRRGTVFDPLMMDNLGISIIPLVCFEDTVPDLARQFVRQEPQVIVNITNDNWFKHSIAVRIHFNNARFRAIELRRPMIRCTNTGVTSIVDTSGKVIKELLDEKTGNTFLEGILYGDVVIPPVAPPTFYARFGDLFSIVLLIVAGVGTVGIGIANRRVRGGE